MTSFKLIAVIEVSETNKVLCQYENCKRSVYKRVHIIKLNGDIKVYGSECYKKLCDKYPESKKAKPIYGESKGIKLTDEERELLVKNTEELIKNFEQSLITEIHQEKDIQNDKVISKTDTELKKLALKITKDDFKHNKHLDPELPGWKGWVNTEAEKLYKELKAKKSEN